MKKLLLASTLLGLLPAVLVSQAPPPSPPAQKAPAAPEPAKPTPPAKEAEPKAPPTPQDNELARAKVENLQLRMQVILDEEQSLPTRKQQIQAQYAQLMQELNTAHPGYAWNGQPGADGKPLGFVKVAKPEPKPMEKK